MPVRRFFAILLISACLGIAACAPAPADVSNIQSSDLRQATNAIPTFSPQTTARPTLTAEMLPTTTPRPTNTDSLAETPTTSDIVLPGWVPEGARARLGRGIISQIALSPDGKTVGVAGATGLSLFDVETLQEIWNVPTGQGLSSLGFTSDGEAIVTLSDCCAVPRDCSHGCLGSGLECLDSRRVQVWNAADGNPVKTIAIDSSYDHLLAVPGGKSVIVWYSEDYSKYSGYFAITKIDLNSLEEQFTISDDQTNTLSALSVTPDGKTLVGGFQNFMVLWSSETGERIRVLEGPADFTYSHLALSRDGSMLASTDHRDIAVWDLAGGRMQRVWRIGYGVRDLALSASGKTLVTVRNEGQGRLDQWDTWDIPSGSRLTGYTAPWENTRTMELFPDGKTLLVGTDHRIHLRDSKTGEKDRMIGDPFSKWSGIGFAGQGEEIILQSEMEKTLSVFDSIRMQRTLEIGYPESAAFSSDLRWYVYPTPDGKIALVETRTGEQRYAIRRPEYFDQESVLVPSADGKTLAIAHLGEVDTTTAEADYMIEIWNLSGAKISNSLAIQTATSIKVGLIFTPDLLRMANIWTDGAVKVYDLYDIPGGRSLGQYAGSPLSNDFSFSRDGESYSGLCSEMNFCIYDVETDDIRRELALISTEVGFSATAFSPDGKLFAAASRDSFITVWETESGRLIQTHKGHNGIVDWISFSLDGTILVSIGGGSAIVWEIGGKN